MSSNADPYVLPDGLPAPEDDGAADHLTGSPVPPLVLESSLGPLDLVDLCAGRGVLYVYPRAGRPGVPMLDGWDAIPGARGCTPQSCGFRDHASELAALGARVAGAPPRPWTTSGVRRRNRMRSRSPPTRSCACATSSGCRRSTSGGLELYKRLAFVAEQRQIVRSSTRCSRPTGTRQDVLDWLQRLTEPSSASVQNGLCATSHGWPSGSTKTPE